jgi:arsenite/tail-anchored protein-transporting ATPase
MELIDNKILLFGGKGGVGKTTCAAATGIYASSKGKKTLVMSTDPAHSLSDSFGIDIGNKITSIDENLDALEIDSRVLLENYKKKYGDLIKQIAEEGTFFSKDDIQQFFDLSLPGMDELMAMLRIIELLDEQKYDLLILDTAPTGHTMRLLELPDVMMSYIKVLAEMRQKRRVVVMMMVRRYLKDKIDNFIEKMHHDITQVKLTLRESTTKFVPVLIPEIMAISETERLLAVLANNEISVGKIIVNQVVTKNCQFCTDWTNEQKKYLDLIKDKFGKFTTQEIPLLPTEVKGDTLKIVSKLLFEKGYGIPILEDNGSMSNENVSFDKLAIRPSTIFLLFGGKGGVGKTTCAAASALVESKSKNVLIFSTDPAHSLSDSFGVTIGNKVTPINNNLSALEIDSNSLLNNLKMKYKKEINNFFSSVFKSTTTATIDAPYDRKVMEDLFDLRPPGIDEIMALKTMMDLMNEKKFDLFILDTAPTGHTIRLLEMPEVAEEWVSTLLEIQDKYPISFEIGETLEEMLDTIKKVRSMLADSSSSEFIVVTIPESMGVSETDDLVSGLKRLKVPVNYIIVNKIVPVRECGFCRQKRSQQLSNIRNLRELKLKIVGVELFSGEIQGQEDLINLGKKLY